MSLVPLGCDTGESIVLLCLFCVTGHRLINHPYLCCLTLVQLPHFPYESLIDLRISKRDCDSTSTRSKAMSFDAQTQMQNMQGVELGP